MQEEGEKNAKKMPRFYMSKPRRNINRKKREVGESAKKGLKPRQKQPEAAANARAKRNPAALRGPRRGISESGGGSTGFGGR
jgi:hypothetical protein